MSLKRLASMVVATSLNQFLTSNCMDKMVNIFVMELMVTFIFKLDLIFNCHFPFS